MKKLFTLTAFIFFLNFYCEAQYVIINDVEFKAMLMSKYPSCFNVTGEMDTTCSAITSEDTLVFHGLGWATAAGIDTYGLQYFDALKYLDFSGNYIMSMPGSSQPMLPSTLLYLNASNSGLGPVGNFDLPAGLKHLDFSNNGLWTGFSLPSSLTYLDCAYNQLDFLPTLPAGLDTLICASQVDPTTGHRTILLNLPALPPSLHYLDCSYNQLYGLPTLPAGLTYLNCANNYYHSLSAMADVPTLQNLPALPASLAYLNCSFNALTDLPALPTSLAYLDCSQNQFIFDIFNYQGISCLPTLPLSLLRLYASGNNLTCLPNTVPGMIADVSLPNCAAGNPNGCPASFNPTITLTPDTINGLTATLGFPSTSGSYMLSADNLIPSSGFVTVEPNTALDVSLDNINFFDIFAGDVQIPYTGGHLPPTQVYVRIAANANGGAVGPFSMPLYHYAPGTGAYYAVQVNGVINTLSPVIVASPAIYGLTTQAGTASASVAYMLSANGLLPVSGNIAATPSAGLEISPDGISFTASSLNIPYTMGQLSNTFVYVRISASAPLGGFSGSITHSGGGAANAIENVNGNVTAPVPVLVAAPDISGLATIAGTASASSSYNLSGNNLYPSSGNITVTPTTSLEVSIDNINFYSSVSVVYSFGTLASTPIFVRISSSAAAGAVSGTITNNGGAAVNAIVNVHGNVTAPAPVLVAAPDISGLVTVAGTASASSFYSLSGNNLVPSSGHITVTPAASLEVSTDNINFSSSVSVAYSFGTLASTPIYVRISSSAATGAVSGTVTNSGGTAVNAIVNVNGNVAVPASPFIVAAPDINGLSTTSGTASASASYILSAHDLVPASGNITVTPAVFLELSADNINFSSSAIPVGYASGLLAATTIYVRISASAPQGAVAGTVINSGGGATDAIVSVSGTAARMFNSILLFPNPASDNVTIYLPGNYSPAFINIYDAYGRLAKAVASANESVPVRLTGLPKGIYIVKIIKNKVEVESKKLIIQ